MPTLTDSNLPTGLTSWPPSRDGCYARRPRAAYPAPRWTTNGRACEPGDRSRPAHLLPKLDSDMVKAWRRDVHAACMESEGFILISLVWSVVIATVFAGLLWAAVQDGRDERRSRGR